MGGAGWTKVSYPGWRIVERSFKKRDFNHNSTFHISHLPLFTPYITIILYSLIIINSSYYATPIRLRPSEWCNVWVAATDLNKRKQLE
jgi:hypothetical protein